MAEPQAEKVDLFKLLVWDVLVKAALAELFTVSLLLAWGPLPAIITFIVNHFANRLYVVMHMAVDLEVIVLNNEAHRRAFDAASVKLKIIAHDKGIDSPEFKEAREEQKTALSTFVQFARAR